MKREADLARLHAFGVTGPVDRVDLPSFDGKMSITFSDFREVAGVQVPFTETRVSGPSKRSRQPRPPALRSMVRPSWLRPISASSWLI